MHRPTRFTMGLLAAVLILSGCYGPFNLTRRLYQWNGQVGTKWEREIVFVILAWLPVYGLTVLGDALVFNSMEFWTGNNPVDPPGSAGKKRSEATRTKRIVRGDAEAVLTYQMGPSGAQLMIEQFRRQHPAGTLTIQQRDGMTVGLDDDGRIVFTAQTLPNNSILVCDRFGRPVATYPSAQVEQFLASAGRLTTE